MLTNDGSVFAPDGLAGRPADGYDGGETQRPKPPSERDGKVSELAKRSCVPCEEGLTESDFILAAKTDEVVHNVSGYRPA